MAQQKARSKSRQGRAAANRPGSREKAPDAAPASAPSGSSGGGDGGDGGDVSKKGGALRLLGAFGRMVFR